MADDIGLPGNNSQKEQKAIRMHVMPENIFEEDTLFRKVNKIPAKKRKVEEIRHPLPEAKPELEEEEVAFEEVPVEEMASIVPAALKRPKRKKSKAPLIIVLVIFIFLASSAAAWYWYQNKDNGRNNEIIQEIKDKNELDDKLAATEETQRLEEEARLAAEKEEKLIRDNQRLVDMVKWQEALKLYYEKNNDYPADFSEGEWSDGELVYLDAIPIDPLNQEEITYVYSRTGEGSYSLSFYLEIGVNELAEGGHLLSEKREVSINGKITDVVMEDNIIGPIVLTTTRDTDLDGVTDLEETLYATNPQKFDSDDDTYTDHQELLNLYAPSGADSQTLLDVGLVKEYRAEQQNYKIYYPSSWKVQALDVDETDIMFVSDTTPEYIHLKKENNLGELALDQWVRLKMQETKVDYQANYYQEEFYTNKKELLGIWLPELFRIYFTDGTDIYSLTYDFDNLKQLAYQTTFEMMAKSFSLIKQDEVAGYEEDNSELIDELDTTEDNVIEEEIETPIVQDESDTNEAVGEEEFVDLLDQYFIDNTGVETTGDIQSENEAGDIIEPDTDSESVETIEEPVMTEEIEE